MAAGLNLSSKSMNVTDSSKNMNLMPPSAFESKRSGDPWKELARTTGELIHMRLENQQLRHEQKPKQSSLDFKEEFRARVDVHKSSLDKDTTRHLDELIQRQAAEITQLKEEMRSLRADHKEEVVGLEKEITQKEREFTKTVSSLQAELKSKEDHYENQVDRLSFAHQQEVDGLVDRIQRLTFDLEGTQTHNGKQITDLSSQLTALTESSQSTIADLQSQLSKKHDSVCELESQILKFKKYVGDSEKGPTPVEVWKKDKSTLERKRTELETEREGLLSTVQLLNIRLTANNEILSLQEKELSKSKVESVDKTKLESLLLTRWREKVYALLVQQKSADIVSKKDFQNWKEKYKNTEANCDTYKNQLEVMTFTVSDKDAQLEIEKKQNKALQEELTSAQQIAITLDDQLTDNAKNNTQLEQALSNFSNFFSKIESDTLSSLATLKTYGQRVSFATGRVEMLQAQFVRKEAHLRLQIEESRKTPAERDAQQMDHSADRLGSSSHLQGELEAVTKERDTLTSQIRQDSLALEARMSACRQEVEEEVTILKASVLSLESALQEQSEKCTKLSYSLDKLENELEEKNERIEDLSTELGKQQQLAQQAVKSREDELKSEFSDKMSDLERQCSEAKREHAKAVVSLRQLQRQTTRDKERSEELAKLSEEHHTRQIEKLQQQQHATEKERNVMMTTLRQEGLLARVKLQREEPILMEEPEEPMSEVTEQVVPPSDKPLTPRKEEPLSAVLEDIESLTAAVIGEVEEETDSDS